MLKNPSFTVVKSSMVDSHKWYTIQVHTHGAIIRFLLDKEESKPSMVVYVDSPWNGGDIYDVHESIYNLLVLKYG